MDWKTLALQNIIGLLSGFLLRPTGAKSYLKLLIKARDYLNLLIPVDLYPEGFYPGLTDAAEKEPDRFVIPGAKKSGASRGVGVSGQTPGSGDKSD